MSVRVTLESVSVRLGGAPVLTALDLEVAPGELLTLLGPSGSGKTTTLNVVAGFVAPSSGSVCFDGASASDVPPERRDLGIVFQSYALFPHLSVGDNVAFPLRARRVGWAQRRQRAEAALELVRLPGLARRPVSSLSGGQQQRVALARALVFGPRALLLDEPLAALDQGLRQALQLEIRRVQREVGVTTIAVTHDQTEALTLSDRVAVLDRGRVVQVGRPEEVYRRPATRFVAGFLGAATLLPVTAGELAGLGGRVAGASHGTAVLRPEDLVLADHGVPAVVRDIAFQGPVRRLALALPDGTELVAVVPSTDPRGAVQPGDGVRVALAHPEGVHVLTEAGAEAEAAAEAAAGAETDSGVEAAAEPPGTPAVPAGSA